MPEAVIWGASGGIGGALVKLLKTNGWRVFAAARDESRIPAEADHVVSFEAGSPATIREAALVIAHETQGIDLMVYAAGGISAETLDKFDLAHWAAVMDANLNGAMLATQVSLNLLKEGGQVMYLGAYVDKITLPKFGAYAAAKAGLETMAAVMQKENRKLRFTVVRPGAVDTPFWAHIPFNLPKGAAQPEAIATAMLTHYRNGGGGLLDL